jgi:AraC family transcriptional regulator
MIDNNYMVDSGSKHQSLAIDPMKEEEMDQILSCTPVLSSAGLGEDHVLTLHYDRHPAHEVQTYTSKHHLLAVWDVNSCANLESRLDNRLDSSLFGHGANGIIPAEMEHWAVWDQEITLTLIALNPKFISQVGSEFAKGKTIELMPKYDTEDLILSQLGFLLKQDLETGHGAGRVYRDSIATALAARLVSHHSIFSSPSPASVCKLSDQRVQLIKDYIQEYLGQDIKLTDLAQLVGLSEYYLCRSFKQTMAISLHQYLIQQRVERAQSLLKRRDLTIVDVAHLCGFSNHSHLTKNFKRILGVLPKAVRSAEE